MLNETQTTGQRTVQIKAPNLQIAMFTIQGNAPYCQHKFSAKARQQMKNNQEQGSTAKGKKQHDPKDFRKCYEQAIHKTKEGWCGIPAPAFRNAMISACRILGFPMTRAKLAVFTIADGFDADDGTPLVKIIKGEPQYSEMCVRNDSGVADIRARPLWKEGWQAQVKIRFDADMFTAVDIANLLARVGMQVGIGEGRPDSKDSAGIGWGTFDVLGAPKENADAA
jgi:hypothetical protein